MFSSSAPCRDCNHGSYQCNGCRRKFCEFHFNSHRQSLTDQLNSLASEYSDVEKILTLPPSYESLTEDADLINKINQWETEVIRQAKEFAAQLREKVSQRSNTDANDHMVSELQQLTEEFQAVRQANNFVESDVQQLAAKLNNLKLQVKNSHFRSVQIRTAPIDWTKHIEMVVEQRPSSSIQRVLHLDRMLTTGPRLTLDVRGAEWYVLGNIASPGTSFLHYQHAKKNKRLFIIDINGHQKQIPWYNDQSIWDSCWSTFLNKFLIVADNQLYTYDDSITTSDSLQLVKEVKTKEESMEYLRCLCIDETLFITYDERNSSIDEYNMNSWALVNNHENIVGKDEIVISLAHSGTSSNLIGLTVLDDKQNWHFELRNRQLRLLSTIPLDRNEFNRRVLSLSNTTTNWLIVHTGSGYFTTLDENAQTKAVVQCAENIDLATYFSSRSCLVVLTQKGKLKFFDL